MNRLKTVFIVLTAYVGFSVLSAKAQSYVEQIQDAQSYVQSTNTQTMDGRHVPHELIVKVKDTHYTLSKQQETSALPYSDQITEYTSLFPAAKHTQHSGTKGVYKLTFNSSVDLNSMLEKYEKSGLFEYVQFNHIHMIAGQYVESSGVIPNDSLFSEQWGLHNIGAHHLAYKGNKYGIDINAPEAWKITTGDSSLIIGILDTGIDYNHKEFKGRIWKNDDIKGNGIDDDKNGYIDDERGWNFISNNNDNFDDNNHGTQGAGVIGANGNDGLGIAGVNWESKLMMVKVMNKDGFGTDFSISQGIIYAVDNGANIINYSIYTSKDNNLLGNAVQYAYERDVPIIAAMGNQKGTGQFYPASYTQTLSAGAINMDGSHLFFSTLGDMDICAPGHYIISLPNDYKGFWWGSSQATFYLSGVISLMRSKDPTLSIEEIRSILHSTARDTVGDPNEDIFGPDIFHGYGLLDAGEAVGYSTDVYETGIVPKNFELNQNYPNPFNPSTSIEYQLSEISDVNLSIYNMLGQLVEKMIYQDQQPGKHSAVFRANDLPSGIYLYRLQAGDKVEAKKMLLVK